MQSETRANHTNTTCDVSLLAADDSCELVRKALVTIHVGWSSVSTKRYYCLGHRRMRGPCSRYGDPDVSKWNGSVLSIESKGDGIDAQSVGAVDRDMSDRVPFLPIPSGTLNLIKKVRKFPDSDLSVAKDEDFDALFAVRYLAVRCGGRQRRRRRITLRRES
jgi:hypothetical protein